MSSPAPRPRFRPARQERSQRTLDSILEAAGALAIRDGLGELTVGDVVEEAGVSTGSFYARFAGREALVHYLENHFWQGVEERWRRYLEPGRWRGATPEALIGALVRDVSQRYAEGGRELRAFLLHAVANPDEKPLRRVLAVEEAVALRVSELLAPAHGAISHPDPAAACAFATAELLAALRADVLAGESAAAAVLGGSGDLVRERTRAFLARLGLDRG